MSQNEMLGLIATECGFSTYKEFKDRCDHRDASVEGILDENFAERLSVVLAIPQAEIVKILAFRPSDRGAGFDLLVESGRSGIFDKVIHGDPKKSKTVLWRPTEVQHQEMSLETLMLRLTSSPKSGMMVKAHRINPAEVSQTIAYMTREQTNSRIIHGSPAAFDVKKTDSYLTVTFSAQPAKKTLSDVLEYLVATISPYCTNSLIVVHNEHGNYPHGHALLHLNSELVTADELPLVVVDRAEMEVASPIWSRISLALDINDANTLIAQGEYRFYTTEDTSQEVSAIVSEEIRDPRYSDLFKFFWHCGDRYFYRDYYLEGITIQEGYISLELGT
jgi:hypothetical protein